MALSDKLRDRDTRTYVLPTIRPTQVLLTCEDTGRTRPSIDRHQEWFVELTVRQNFWANKAQFSSARDEAVKMLAHELYGDIHKHMHRLRTCIFSGDRDGALECCDLIETEMKP